MQIAREPRNDKQRGPNSTPQLGWFHRYPARFHSDVLCQMFEGVEARLGRAPKIVLDPFAGTGSTLSFAKQQGIPSIGIELTPLGVLISKVRLNPLRCLDTAGKLAEGIAAIETERIAHDLPLELVFWIGQRNTFTLAIYLDQIARVKDTKLRRWLRLAVSASLRPSSKWLVGSIKPQIDPDRKPSTISGHFLRCARAIARDCETEWASFTTDTNSRILRGNAQQLKLPSHSVEAIITSPPYGTMYDYFDVHRLTYLAFGWNYDAKLQIGRSSSIERDGVGFKPPRHMARWYREQFRAEETGDGRALRAYFVAMQYHLVEAKRVLKRNGVLAYAMANTFKKGNKFSLALAVADQIRKTGFQDVQMVRRENSHRRILPAGRDRQTGRFSTNAPEVSVDECLIFARR